MRARLVDGGGVVSSSASPDDQSSGCADQLLRAADWRHSDFPPLPYEAVIDREQATRKPGRRRKQADGTVTNLADRRLG